MALYTVSISKSAASSSGTEVKIVPTLPSGSGTSVSIGSDNAPDTVTIGSGSGSQDAYTVSISNAATDTANASVSIGSDNAPSTVSIGGGSTLVSATVGVGRGPAGPQGVAGNNGTDGTNGTDGLGFTGGSYAASTGVVTFTSNDGLGFATGDLRGNVDLSSPDPIGDVAPNTGAFTSLIATSYSGDGSGLTGLATSAQGALADSATQPADLATVATTGGYSDLTGLPTLGTAAATASTDYATAAQGTTADSAVQPNSHPTLTSIELSAALPTITLDANDVYFGISAGTGVGSGGNIRLFGGSHATQASDVIFRSNATTTLKYDYSATEWDFRANDITTTGTVAATSFAGDGSALTGIAAGATGGGNDDIFYENGQNVTTNYTITNGKNAMSAGPITIDSGVTVTVGAGETWTVI